MRLLERPLDAFSNLLQITDKADYICLHTCAGVP